MTPLVVVAGGRGTRMGGAAKALLPLGPGTVLDAILARLGPQAAPIAVSWNGDPRMLPGLPALPDAEPGLGPLAGVLAAMAWAGALGAPHVLTWPGDAPFPPPDLAARLLAAGAPAHAAVARAHPLAALWPVAARADLARLLAAGERRVGAAARALGSRAAAFPDEGAFLNVNAPPDLARARARLPRGGAGA